MSVSLQTGFPVLIGVAFLIACLGLAGNFHYLLSLMGSESSLENLTHHFLPALKKTQQISENHVFQRMLRKSIASLEDCQQREADNKQSITSDWMKTRPKQLARFGFMNGLTNYLSVPSAVQHSQCVYPPATACQVSSYSILATSMGLELRSLFLNCMSWLTYPGVANMHVLLPKNRQEFLAQDRKYGQRLLTWDKDATHKVHIVWVETIWGALANVTQLSDSILFMDADVEYLGNGRGIEAGFELWKRHSNDVIASSGWHMEIETRRRLDDHANNLTSEKLHSVCKDQRVTTSVQQDVQLVALSGVFIHRSLLCFVLHPVLKPFRLFTINLQEERVALSILVSQLSGHAVRLFPATVRGPGEGRRTRSTNKEGRSLESLRLQEVGLHIQHHVAALTTPGSTQSKPVKSTSLQTKTSSQKTPKTVEMDTIRTSQRVLKTAAERATATTEGKTGLRTSTGVVKTKRSILADPVTAENRRLGLNEHDDEVGRKTTRSMAESSTLSSTHQRLGHNDDFVSAIIGYFGSVPVESISWCASGCSITEDALASEVSWVSETCGVADSVVV